MVEFFIISTGYNCHKSVKKCIESVNNQTYTNYEAMFISDGSTDNTGAYIQKYCQPHFFEVHHENMGAAYRRFNVMDFISPDAVVVLLGLDDELKPDALERVAKEYENGKLMTYGNWISQKGFVFPASRLYFHEDVHKDRTYRLAPYRSTALNTFRRDLFDHFTEEDFKHNGEWIKATTESNLMLSLMEMLGEERIGVIEDVIYLYNSRRDNARRRLGNEYQAEIFKDVINKPKRELI